MLKKMIILDLDGTLLNKKNKVSNLTKEYLEKLKEKGYIIVIATGRSLVSVFNATDGAKFANYIITDSGACIYDGSNSKNIFSNYIDSKVIGVLLSRYAKESCSMSLFNSTTTYKYSLEVEKKPNYEVTDDIEYLSNNCKNISHVVISMKNNDAVMQIYNAIVNEFKDLEVAIMQDSFDDRKSIEIMPKNSSKYNRIKDLASMLDISNDEIIAFGDGLNDVEMINNCGWGVAIFNALPEVKAVADDITSLDHNNDGVINYLKEYLSSD